MSEEEDEEEKGDEWRRTSTSFEAKLEVAANGTINLGRGVIRWSIEIDNVDMKILAVVGIHIFDVSLNFDDD